MKCPVINGECNLYNLMKREIDRVESLRQNELYQKISHFIHKEQFAEARTQIKEISCGIQRKKLENNLYRAIEYRNEIINYESIVFEAEEKAQNGNLQGAIDLLQKNVEYPSDDIKRLKEKYPPKKPNLLERLSNLWKTQNKQQTN